MTRPPADETNRGANRLGALGSPPRDGRKSATDGAQLVPVHTIRAGDLVDLGDGWQAIVRVLTIRGGWVRLVTRTRRLTLRTTDQLAVVRRASLRVRP